MNTIKLPFALDKNNTIVHIDHVERGKHCCCICPSCKLPLMAVKGNQKQHHFRHANHNECEYGLESSIHIIAKQIIVEKQEITLPEYRVEVSAKDSMGKDYVEVEIKDAKNVEFDHIKEEVEIYGMRADILAEKSNKQLVIEIFYSHKVGDEKLAKIKNANISAIEIDLSGLVQEDLKDRESFWLTINDQKNIKWLHNSKELEIRQKLKKQLDEKMHEQEKKYEIDKIAKERKVQSEKKELLRSLGYIPSKLSNENKERLKQKAEAHQLWKQTKRNLPFTFHDIPSYLNENVKDGDWIFECDRRVWQTAIYHYFINYNGKSFSIKRADDWLQKNGCKVSKEARTVGICGRKYPELLPDDFYLPSPWNTLKAYFEHLVKLGVLEFSGIDYKKPGNYWFKPIVQEFIKI